MKHLPLLLTIIGMMVSVTSYAYDDVNDDIIHPVLIDGIYYFLDQSNLTATVTFEPDEVGMSMSSYSGSVSIPASFTIDDVTYSVTRIDAGAFLDCSDLTSVTIPNSVTSIGFGSFQGCVGLSSVTIPNSVTSIEDYAFQDCTSLPLANIPNSVKSIGAGAFYGCTGLTEVNIPNSVKSISHWAFHDCIYEA